MLVVADHWCLKFLIMTFILNPFDVWPLCCAIDTRIDFLLSLKKTNEELYSKCLYDVEVNRLRVLRNNLFAQCSV